MYLNRIGETFWDHSVLDLNDNPVQMTKIRNVSAILIVNIALDCAYAWSKFKELNDFYARSKNNANGGGSVEVLGFPCGQFGHELLHPETAIIERYNVTFPVFRQVDVNGPSAAPLYSFLKRKTSPTGVLYDCIVLYIFNQLMVI